MHKCILESCIYRLYTIVPSHRKQILFHLFLLNKELEVMYCVYT